MAVAAASGAGAMLRADPADLRDRVTAPGGTTDAALSVLASDALEAAVRAAALRSASGG
ncbi:pyrroline-5-carboxylate reductase dimerization domain-containing protein [Streptomyces sp. NPDC087866]|uniref:pyrroline-5-carboxylate reductase dimerization domain-containing protein n=1 Tax=unclassified Streptomyces TaxID=2593676 RepID=UPI0033BAD59D